MKDKDRLEVLRMLVYSWDSRRPVRKEIQEDLQSEAVLEQVRSGQNWDQSVRVWGHGSQGTAVFILK